MGDLFFTADAYYELKNAGYYSPQLYEGYVQKPMITIAAEVGAEYNLTLL